MGLANTTTLDRQRDLKVAVTKEKLLLPSDLGSEAKADKNNNNNKDDDDVNDDGMPSDLDKGAIQVRLDTSGRKSAVNETKRSSDDLSF